MNERSGPGWNGYIGGQCPVQGCGHVDGFPWYFRARGAAWSFEVVDDKSVDPEILPLVNICAAGWEIEEDYGTHSDAGYMSLEKAWALIESSIEKFRAGLLPYVQAKP